MIYFSFALSIYPVNAGIRSAARIARITSTTMSSTSVNPFLPDYFLWALISLNFLNIPYHPFFSKKIYTNAMVRSHVYQLYRLLFRVNSPSSLPQQSFRLPSQPYNENQSQNLPVQPNLHPSFQKSHTDMH